MLFGNRRLLGGPSASLNGLVSNIVLGTLALYITYLLSPGYVISGYLARGAPLFVFAVDVMLAIGLYLCSRRPGCRHRAEDRGGAPACARLATAVAAFVLGSLSVILVGLFGVALGLWVHVQRGYLTLFHPPFRVPQDAGRPPYVGQSFAGNRYMAPPAAYTGQWAYIDATIGQARIELKDDGYHVAQELQTYVWLHDRATNPEYREPRYYLCTRFQSLPDALARAQGRESLEGSCNDLPIVKRADSSDQPFLQYRVVARDPSPFGSWAIVELDWDFPPYLQPFPGGSGPARVTFTPRDACGPAADIQYRYAQQKSVPESDTLLRLYRRDIAGGMCLLAEPPGPGPIPVSAGETGSLVVSVQPGTATKRGPEYMSEPVSIGGAAATCP